MHNQTLPMPSKRNILIFLSLLLLINPFLGLPYSWKIWLAFLWGLLILLVTITTRPTKMADDAEDTATYMDSIIEEQTEIVITDTDTQNNA